MRRVPTRASAACWCRAKSTPRYRRIRYRGFDAFGVPIDRTVADFHARVVQHECDHLDGVLYPQRMAYMTTLAFSDVLQAEADARGEEIELDVEG